MLIIGHRGARGLAPENTIEAIRAGLTHGADIVEIDVRVSKDGIPVLVHDPYLRINETKHTVRRRSFKELKALKPDLATLDEALRAIGGKKPVIVEIKPRQPMQPIFDVLKNRMNNEWKQKDLRVASFSYAVLRLAKRDIPNAALIVNHKWSGIIASSRARRLGTPYITMNERWLWNGFIKSVSRRYKLAAYTINDPQRAKKWASSGLYAAITDFPDKY